MSSENKNWNKIFTKLLEYVDFELIQHKDGFGLIDITGANLGNIESDRFGCAADIIDRLDIYIEDYIISDARTKINDMYDGATVDFWEDILNYKMLFPESIINILELICVKYTKVHLCDCL